MVVAPETAWTLLTDIEMWPRWGPTVAGVSSTRGLRDGSCIQLGSEGRIRPALLPRWASLEIPFRVDDYIDLGDRRRWTWQVAGVRATSHEVIASGSGCTVVMSAPWWAAPYAPILWLGLRNLERLGRAIDHS
jgi:hypothetical protein